MKKGSPVIIILIAVIIVVIVSLLPLSKWSGGRIKDFSLFSDILKEVGIMEGEPSYATAENIDPELLKAAAEAEKKRKRLRCRASLLTRSSLRSNRRESVISSGLKTTQLSAQASRI